MTPMIYPHGFIGPVPSGSEVAAVTPATATMTFAPTAPNLGGLIGVNLTFVNPPFNATPISTS
jgi:hypothetical protein